MGNNLTVINKLILTLEEFRKLDAEMPVQTALTFLLVAKYQTKRDGFSVKDVATMLGVSTAAASRNVSKLTEHGVKSVGGHGLVTTAEDPLFRVRKLINLTPKGERVMRSLEELINER